MGREENKKKEKRKRKKEKKNEEQGKREKKKRREGGGGVEMENENEKKEGQRWDLNPGPTECRALVGRGDQWSGSGQLVGTNHQRPAWTEF